MCVFSLSLSPDQLSKGTSVPVVQGLLPGPDETKPYSRPLCGPERMNHRLDVGQKHRNLSLDLFVQQLNKRAHFQYFPFPLISVVAYLAVWFVERSWKTMMVKIVLYSI